MSSIFISYSRKDLKIAEKIVSALAESKLDTWIDTINIPKGEKIEQEIYHGIEGSNAVLFFVSSASVNSKWCKQEIIHATLNNKRIIPIVIQDTDEASIPIDVKERLWIDCRENQSDFDTAIKEIVKAIIADNEWVKYHTRLQLRALDWENSKDSSRLLRGSELQEAEQQLASAGSKKDPQPTDLQRHYVLTSRKDDVHRRRRSTTILVFALFIITIISIFAFIQRNNAIDREIARATAQAISEEQANIALARQLATQAQLLYNKQDSSPLLATLLAIESNKRFSNAEADLVIRNSLNLLFPLYKIIPLSHSDEIIDITYSPDGNFIASSSLDNKVIIWNINSDREIATYQHSGEVTYLQFSPDDKYFFTQNRDGNVYFWDVTKNNLLLKSFHGKGEAIFDLTPDGRIIVTSGVDGVIRIWEINTRREIAIANNNNKPINFIAISPDGRKVATIGEDAFVKVWDARNGNLIMQKSTNTTPWALEFSPNSERIISNNGVGSEIWDAETGNRIISLNTNSVGKFLFHPSGEYVATLSVNSKSVEIWNTSSGELVTNLSHDFFVYYVEFSSDGKYLASGAADGVIKLWNPINGQELGRIIKSGSSKVAFSPNNDFISSPADNAVYVFKISKFEASYKLPNNGEQLLYAKIDPTGEWVASLNQNESIANIIEVSSNTLKSQVSLNSRITTLSFSYDGDILITGDNNGNACIWNIPDGKENICFNHNGFIRVVKISPNSQFVAVVYGANQNPGTKYFTSIWNIQNGEKVFEVEQKYFTDYIAFSIDSRLIAISSIERFISLWDISSQKEVGRFERTFTIVTGEELFFNPSGEWFVINGGDGARVWSLTKFEEISKIVYSSEEFFNLETVLKTIISPDQTRLASVNTTTLLNLTLDAQTKRESTIRVWDPLSGKEYIRFVHNSWVTDIIWSPDGKYIISGGWDGLVRIWDVNNGQEIGIITHDSSITQLQFTSNGEKLVSISEDGEYKISNLSPTNLISEACSRVTRNLTQQEWVLYIGNTNHQVTCSNNSSLNAKLEFNENSITPYSPTLIESTATEEITLNASTQENSNNYGLISNEVTEVNLRKTPGYSNKNDETDVIIKISSGETILIIDGPVEEDGLIWWQIHWNGYEGWIADHTSTGRTIIVFTP